MTEWRTAQKKPIRVQFREVKPKTLIRVRHFEDGSVKEVWGEVLKTGHNDSIVFAYPNEDFVIRDEAGEYPIKKEIFEKTYEIVRNCSHKEEK